MDVRIPGFEREMEIASELMSRSGEIILDNYCSPQCIETKPDGTLVTEVDKKVSRLISSTLEDCFPDYGILDEEQEGKGLNRQRIWVVDPLDGTKEYVEKTGDFGIIIGLLDGYIPAFGMTYKPQTGEFAYAAKGQGSYLFRNGDVTKLTVSDSDDIYALVSRSRSSEELRAMLDSINPDSVTLMGGSLKTIEIAKGDATLFICPRTSKMSSWDLCAPSVILEEAGGRLTDVYGNQINYKRATANYNGIVATNGRIHNVALERISPLL